MNCKIFRTTEHDVCCSNVAIVLIILGVSLTLLSLVYPAEPDSELDPGQSAAENESERIRQANTRMMVYILSFTGMAFVTCGGVMSSFLLTKYILLDECVTTDERTDLESNGNQELGTRGRSSSSTSPSILATASAETQKSALVEHDYCHPGNGQNDLKHYGSIN